MGYYLPYHMPCTQYLVVGVLVGLLWFGSGGDQTVQAANDIYGMLFFEATFTPYVGVHEYMSCTYHLIQISCARQCCVHIS